jgi:hypothetical protein
MATYLFLPENYIDQHSLLNKIVSLRYILSVQSVIQTQTVENTVLFIYLEYYEAEFYLPIYTRKEFYISVNARSPPPVYAEI